MALINPSEGRRRDWPMIEAVNVASAAAGSAADASTILCALPDLTLSDLPNDMQEHIVGGILPTNRSRVRQAVWVNNAATRTASGSTNYVDWQLRLYRAGALQGVLAYITMQVNTTVAGAVTATGVQAVTPGSMNAIVPGTALYIDSGGSPELVYVISTTASTFTANFTKTHSGGFTVTSSLVQNTPVALTPAKAVAGALSATTISTGSQAVTPSATNGINGMYGIHVGDWLYFSGGTGAAETTQVTAVTATTFTCTFANGHSGGYTFSTTQSPNNGGGTAAPSGDAFEINGGDVLVLSRVSNNATGLATDAGLFQVDWVPSRIAR